MTQDFLSEFYDFYELEYQEDLFALLIYDIVDNKRRQKLSVYLEVYCWGNAKKEISEEVIII